MRRLHLLSYSFAVVPYLLLSSSQQAGVVTHLYPDGSGERLVYARCAPGREGEVSRHLTQVLPTANAKQKAAKTEGGAVTLWRDLLTADLAQTSEIQISSEGVLQTPLSFFTRHTWKETLSFDRGAATDVEVHGQELAKLRYVLRMPGTVVSQSPPATTEGNRVEWELKASSEPQILMAESRSVRWGYLLVCLYVLLFLIVKAVGAAQLVLRRLPRRPRKI